jgi:hypothetical protein
MFNHPHISSEVARYRQQEMAAQARRQHQAAQLRAQSRETRQARRAGGKLGRHLLSIPAQWYRTARA